MPPLPEPWVGVNVWGLAAAQDVYACGGRPASHQEKLNSTFAHLREVGVDVVRFWAFQSYAIDAGGNRNWAALDRVFAGAEAHGIYLMPVLGNNWTDCDYWPESLWPDGGQRKDLTGWYATGYQGTYDGYLTNYRQWVNDIVSRYARHPALADWELMNEPQGDNSALTAFFTDAASDVRAADPVTPISLGTIGGGQPGLDGPKYGAMLTIPDVTWATAHDYGYQTDPLPISPSCPYDWNCIRTDIRDAQALGKPFFVGEAGDSGCDTSAKAANYAAKMRAAFDAGAVGYLLWAYDDNTPPANCGYGFGPNGEVIKIFADF